MAQRQPSRKALYFPFVLLLILAVGWTVGWFYLRGEARGQMDTGVAELRAQGYSVTWQERTFGGFPFRMDVNLTGFRMSEPSGWGVRAPSVRAEAFVYSLGNWVAVAPQGVVLDRPVNGAVQIKGKALRASLRQLESNPPRVAVEGAGLSFIPIEGGQPFMLRTAEKLDLHLRPGPQDHGAVLLRVTNAQANLPGQLARLAPNEPVGMNLELIYDKASAMKGANWRSMAQNWAAAGGSAMVRTGSLSAGGAVLAASGGGLSVGADGRAEGALDLDLAKAGNALSNLTGGLVPPTASFGGMRVVFQNGQTTLAPIPFPIAPAPRIY